MDFGFADIALAQQQQRQLVGGPEIVRIETNDAPDQHVFEELQAGYKLKDRLLRPAMVRVASNPK